jgi:hypothetical protein
MQMKPDERRLSMLHRREFLRVGTLGAGLTLGQYMEMSAAEQSDEARSAILVFLKGGPSHQDTFDMKPDAPAEYRGEFRPIKTNVEGVQICEHLPQLAQRANQYAIVRGISHNLADHGIGTKYLMTGNRPIPLLKYPSFGAVVSKTLNSPPDVPCHVAIDEDLEGPGFLGTQFGALATGEKPRANQPFSVRGITLSDGLSIEQFNRRRNLANDVDSLFKGYETLDEQVQGLDEFSRRAHQIIGSTRARQAFDLAREEAAVVHRFGPGETGQSLLLACRLIEAGVRFVTVVVDGWDTHNDNFTELRTKLLPEFDRGFSALLDTLGERGLLSSTVVLATGEFGRTPKVNAGRGRDHWARASVALLGGGNIRGGQVIGASDDKAAEPADTGYSPDDLAATFYHHIGIDPHQEFKTDTGRPVMLVREGNLIRDL